MALIEGRKKLKKGAFIAYLEGEIGDFTYMTRKEGFLWKKKRIFLTADYDRRASHAPITTYRLKLSQTYRRPSDFIGGSISFSFCLW